VHGIGDNVTENYDHFCAQLINQLKAAEKRHLDAYANASANDEWEAAVFEFDRVKEFFNCRRILLTSKNELKLTELDTVFMEEIVKDEEPLFTETVYELPMDAPPISLTFLGQTYEVESWADLYEQVCEDLVVHNPFDMMLLHNEAELNPGSQVNFSPVKADTMRAGKRLSNGMWIEADKTSDEIINICRKLLKRCGFSSDTMQIEVLEG